MTSETQTLPFLILKTPSCIPAAFKKVIESDNKLPKNWKMKMPDFESHLDEIGYIEDGDEESELSSFEEE